MYCGAVQEVIRVKKLNVRVPLGTVRVESQTRNQINTQAKGLIPIRETNLVQTVNQRSRINKTIVDGRKNFSIKRVRRNFPYHCGFKCLRAFDDAEVGS